MQIENRLADDYATMEHLKPRRGGRPKARKHWKARSPHILLSHYRCNNERGRAPVPQELFDRAEALAAQFDAEDAATRTQMPRAAAA